MTKLLTRWWHLLWLGLISPVSHAQTDITDFTATPEQCVALHKGQMCYQDVTFKWSTPNAGKYCLMQSNTNENPPQQPITCWEGQALTQYSYSFENTTTTTFQLIRQGQPQPLAKVKVVVTWVYKAPKQSQSGWRLF
ncbi:DUF3019 domain-containing protein [Shewanella intestini]|uniref:DUF3019 domain-containing protein n=1 Tax=Shewanella intestini TaxID=2017544 RepID=A0ABS5HZS9_9GAMM|nr:MULTISPECIES: DUF3019 domain-containing protein [Shewanella]MBR9727176.1 DUF3019 domain-containing protein [Shewanella intestini]MRG35978.1 DUF3019 domain-containing protein [Shewanella sp. XMDDZSB0408]